MIWNIDNLDTIGGHKTTVLGAPTVIETAAGKAVEFDGESDALFIDYHPLADLEMFTAEVVFCPYANGRPEQRFFHMQEDGSEHRVLFETRLTDDNQWFLDTFVHFEGGSCALFAADFKHPIGPWYHAALTVDGKMFRHFVDGNLELEEEMAFVPQGAGRTSLGTRINQVDWYKGAIRQACFTPRILSPAEFLNANP